MVAGIYLFSDLGATFERNSAPFVAEAGGARARIGVLMGAPTGWEPYFPRYRDPWLRLGAGEVVPVVPGGVLDALSTASGIFVCGGDTRLYHAAYAHGPAAELIRRRHAEGVPYAGLSAGAIIAADPCILWGDRLTTADNVLALRGADDGCDADLQTAPGLGLLRGCLVEPHLAERGGLPRLVAAMERSGTPLGLGLDDPTCVEVRDGGLTVHGRGRAWMVERALPGPYRLRTLDPGARVSIHLAGTPAGRSPTLRRSAPVEGAEGW